MGLKIKLNTQHLEVSILQIGEKALANGARSLRRIAERVERLAKEYAPLDDGDLQNAIETLKGKDEHMRVTYIVRVNPDVVASMDGEGNAKKHVADYALLMERGMRPQGSGYNPGPGTLQKRDAGMDAGGKFMARAFKKGVETAHANVAAAIRAYMGGGRALVESQNSMKGKRQYDGENE